MTRGIAYKTRITATLLAFLVTMVSIAGTTAANPFETLPGDHWSYGTLKSLSRKGFVQRYVEDRLHLGYEMTYFDVAMWLGEALRRFGPDDRSPFTFTQLVDAFDEAHPDTPLSQQDRWELAELIGLVRDHLEMLGYPIPGGLEQVDRDGIRLDGVARALEQFRMRGESRIVYQDVNTSNGVTEMDRPNLEQTHTLRLSGPVTDRLSIGTVVRGESRLRMDGGDDEMFRLGSEGIDLAISGSAIARIGRVTGSGLSELAVGGMRELTGFQAALQTGQLGSKLLVARTRPELDPTTPPGENEALVTAWDGSVQVNERLQLGATVAYMQGEAGDAEEAKGESMAVVSVGGTYSVSPQLTLTTEMAQNPVVGDSRARCVSERCCIPCPSSHWEPSSPLPRKVFARFWVRKMVPAQASTSPPKSAGGFYRYAVSMSRAPRVRTGAIRK